MRPAITFLLASAVALGGCAGAIPPGSTPEYCEAIFRNLDRVSRGGQGDYSYVDDRPILRPEISRLSLRALNYDCITFPGDLANLDAVRQDALRDRRLDDSARLEGPPVSVHLGVLTSITDEVLVTSLFRSLGYPVRSFGADGFGRRIYVGPLASEGQVEEVRGVARRAGFIAPYPTTWPRL
jgi:hypothetical protein